MNALLHLHNHFRDEGGGESLERLNTVATCDGIGVVDSEHLVVLIPDDSGLLKKHLARGADGYSLRGV